MQKSQQTWCKSWNWAGASKWSNHDIHCKRNKRLVSQIHGLRIVAQRHHPIQTERPVSICHRDPTTLRIQWVWPWPGKRSTLLVIWLDFAWKLLTNSVIANIFANARRFLGPKLSINQSMAAKINEPIFTMSLSVAHRPKMHTVCCLSINVSSVEIEMRLWYRLLLGLNMRRPLSCCAVIPKLSLFDISGIVYCFWNYDWMEVHLQKANNKN